MTPQLHARELLYPANLLTISRFLLIPATLYTLEQPERRRLALTLLAVTMLTDALDGPLARSRGEVSQLGQILDPVADKLLIDGAAVLLSRHYGFPWWVTGLLIFRDLGIVAAALLMVGRHAEVPAAGLSGKLTTLLLTVAALAYLAGGPRLGRPLLTLALIPFGSSFVEYGRAFRQAMRRPH
jgi:CDP-diacylglycerol---glycerol-3-phosphate 3-phosphatidyltransferase